MRRMLVLAIVTLGVAALESGRPYAAKNSSNPGVTVTFGDRAGDGLVSDGYGPYVNGVAGVMGQIWVSGSGYMTLNLSSTRPNRVFNGTYTPASDVAQPTANPPGGTFSDGWFINVGDVWHIPVGATVSTGASFAAGVGSFRWCAPGSFCAGLATTELVTVTRPSVETWQVSADPPSSTALGSDLAVLLDQIHNRWQAIGYYRMPFQLTIQCVNAGCQ